MKSPSLTIGVEEEYQIIDPETRELRSFITQFMESKAGAVEVVKGELKTGEV
ncbi:MAG: carboxylate-amine ligase, partial [Anaerolineae bacterium]|nr:carboxylate-amine ligase [Anaerolineae bacterium]